MKCIYIIIMQNAHQTVVMVTLCIMLSGCIKGTASATTHGLGKLNVLLDIKWDYIERSL